MYTVAFEKTSQSISGKAITDAFMCVRSSAAVPVQNSATPTSMN